MLQEIRKRLADIITPSIIDETYQSADIRVPGCEEDHLVAIRQLVPKISASTLAEREIIFQVLKLFPDSIQLKDIGAVESLTSKVKDITSDESAVSDDH